MNYDKYTGVLDDVPGRLVSRKSVLPRWWSGMKRGGILAHCLHGRKKLPDLGELVSPADPYNSLERSIVCDGAICIVSNACQSNFQPPDRVSKPYRTIVTEGRQSHYLLSRDGQFWNWTKLSNSLRGRLRMDLVVIPELQVSDKPREVPRQGLELRLYSSGNNVSFFQSFDIPSACLTSGYEYSHTERSYRSKRPHPRRQVPTFRMAVNDTCDVAYQCRGKGQQRKRSERYADPLNKSPFHSSYLPFARDFQDIIDFLNQRFELGHRLNVRSLQRSRNLFQTVPRFCTRTDCLRGVRLACFSGLSNAQGVPKISVSMKVQYQRLQQSIGTNDCSSKVGLWNSADSVSDRVIYDGAMHIWPHYVVIDSPDKRFTKGCGDGTFHPFERHVQFIAKTLQVIAYRCCLSLAVAFGGCEMQSERHHDSNSYPGDRPSGLKPRCPVLTAYRRMLHEYRHNRRGYECAQKYPTTSHHSPLFV